MPGWSATVTTALAAGRGPGDARPILQDPATDRGPEAQAGSSPCPARKESYFVTSKPDISLAEGFRHVDETGSVSRFADCLIRQNEHDTFIHYKEQSFAFLNCNPGKSILDVGCGAGFDLLRLKALVGKTGKVVGADESMSLIELAAQRVRKAEVPIEFVVGDAKRLPWADGTFDGCRIDRSLQHIQGPEEALAEMCRVTKRGGRVVASEPDWGTYVLGSTRDPHTMASVEEWSNRIQNPFVGRELPEMLLEIGLRNLEIKANVLLTRGFEQTEMICDLEPFSSSLVEAGKVASRDAEQWWREKNRLNQEGGFIALLTVVTVGGAK